MSWNPYYILQIEPYTGNKLYCNIKSYIYQYCIWKGIFFVSAKYVVQPPFMSCNCHVCRATTMYVMQPPCLSCNHQVCRAAAMYVMQPLVCHATTVCRATIVCHATVVCRATNICHEAAVCYATVVCHATVYVLQWLVCHATISM